MKRLPVFITMFIFLLCTTVTVWGTSGKPAITPDDALKQLKEGNDRYLAGKSTHLKIDASRMKDTTKNGQHPFATVIGCSDSRVPIEIIFDQGIGDIFVIRVAGNVCDVDEIGSIEYGIDHLKTPLMVVLGHTHCGAVTAVVTEAEVHGSIPPLIDNIHPAVAKARKNNPKLIGNALIKAAVKANVWQSIEDLFKGSPAARRLTKSGSLKVVGAIYNIESGQVDILGTHPAQERLTTSAKSH